MNHNMRLIDIAYNSIINGTKRVEIRLLDEKRSKLRIGDTITFTNYNDLNKNINVIITDLKIFNDINEVINNYDISLLLNSDTSKEDLIKTFNKIYSTIEQKKYKVITIEFKIKNDR